MGIGSVFEGLFGSSGVNVNDLEDPKYLDLQRQSQALSQSPGHIMSGIGTPLPLQPLVTTAFDKLMETLAKSKNREEALDAILAAAKEHTAKRVAAELARDNAPETPAHSHAAPAGLYARGGAFYSHPPITVSKQK